MNLETILSAIANTLYGLGAHHVSVGAVSHHFGEILTRHWRIVITWRG